MCIMFPSILLFLFQVVGCLSSTPPRVPPRPTSILSFNQTLDHFRFDSNATFSQKVLVYSTFYQTGGPILLYFGNEGDIFDFYNNTGAMFEIAEQVGGLIVFLEHRYYGSTLPFGGNSYETKNLVYLTIEQALADMASFIAAKSTFLKCDGDVILFGGSYGGMLSAWFQVKYPHLVLGSLAASAPVDIYPGEHKQKEFFDAGMFVYGKFGTPSCESWIRTALRRLSKLGGTKEGRVILMKQFLTCGPVDTNIDVQRLLLYVNGALSTMAMVDYPFAASFVTPMPANPVSYACNATATLHNESDDTLLMQGLATVINVFVNFTAQLSCHNISQELLSSSSSSSLGPSLGPSLGHVRGCGGHHSLGNINRPWNYQACTELILEPLTSDGDGFFVPDPSIVGNIEAACRKEFKGVQIRPNWMRQAYGNGEQIVKSTHNIIFSDGEKDPWRVGGVPSNAIDIGDGSVVHILIEGGAHHQDLRYTSSEDPATVTAAKKVELGLIMSWIEESKKYK